MAVNPPKPYCHTNKRQMYGSQSTQALNILSCHTFVFYFRVFERLLFCIPYETSSAVQRCNIASKPLCSGNAANLQRLCSCLAVEVMLQRAAIPLCGACSGVHQFAAILQRHLSLSSDCHFAVMRCTKITHRAIKYTCCSGSCKIYHTKREIYAAR